MYQPRSRSLDQTNQMNYLEFSRKYTKLTVLYNIDIKACKSIPAKKEVSSSGHWTRDLLCSTHTLPDWDYIITWQMLIQGS